MFELIEAFDIEDALRSFNGSDLCSACSALLQALGYSFIENPDFDDGSIDKFIYFSAPNRVYFSSQERSYLTQISSLKYICEISQHDLLEKGYNVKKIIIIAVDLICTKSDRSEVSYYITKILNKLFNDYLFIIFKHQDYIEFCTKFDNGLVCMSDWFNTSQPTLTEIYTILELSPSSVIGVNNIKEYYEEISYGFSREYIKRPESYEYMAYECFPKITDDIIEETVSKEAINEFAEKRKNYYMELYGDDYVVVDTSFVVMEDNDEDWTMFELDALIPPEAQKELDEEYFDNELNNDDNNDIDYSQIDENILNDPVKLLEFLESWYKETENNERLNTNSNKM